MKKALIVWGGWLGHQPEEVSALFRGILEGEGYEVEVSDTLAAFDDGEKLKTLDLIIPVWTMGEISQERVNRVSEAVQNGVGLAGCHGGMCDAFRNNVDWQFMTAWQLGGPSRKRRDPSPYPHCQYVKSNRGGDRRF